MEKAGIGVSPLVAVCHTWANGRRSAHLQRFQLVSLPEHYKLYAHRTAGQRSRPRKDYYLYGKSLSSSTNSAYNVSYSLIGSGTPGCEYFRSPEEFTLHAEWLTLGCPINTDGTSSCGCCYCSGRKQGDISKKLKKHVAHICIRETAIRNRTGATRPQNVVWSGNRRSERLQHGIRISSQQIYAANTWSKKRNTATSVSERVTSWLEGLGDPVPQSNRA